MSGGAAAAKSADETDDSVKSFGAEAVVEMLLHGGDVTLVTGLLDDGADPNQFVREDDVSPMHIAAGLDNHASYTFLSLLLKYKGDPNVKSAEGLTPLHISAIWGRKESLNLLLEHGADATIPDSEGKTALDWAKEEGQDGCIIMLLEEAIKSQLKTSRNSSRSGSVNNSPTSETMTPSKYQSPKLEVQQFLAVRRRLRKKPRNNNFLERVSDVKKKEEKSVLTREDDSGLKDSPFPDTESRILSEKDGDVIAKSTKADQRMATPDEDDFFLDVFDLSKCGILSDNFSPMRRKREEMKTSTMNSYKSFISNLSSFTDEDLLVDERIAEAKSKEDQPKTDADVGAAEREPLDDKKTDTDKDLITDDPLNTRIKENAEINFKIPEPLKNQLSIPSTLNKLLLNCKSNDLGLRRTATEKKQSPLKLNNVSMYQVHASPARLFDETVKTDSMLEFETLEAQIELQLDQSTFYLFKQPTAKLKATSETPQSTLVTVAADLKPKQVLDTSLLKDSSDHHRGLERKGSKKRFACEVEAGNDNAAFESKKAKTSRDVKESEAKGEETRIATRSLDCTGILGVDQPTFYDNSLTMVTAQGSHVEDSVSALAINSSTQPAASDDTPTVLPPNPPQQRTSIIMDKFLESFKVPAGVPINFKLAQPKSFAIGLHDNKECDVGEASFISIHPCDVSSVSKASSYASCLTCEKGALDFIYTDDEENVKLVERIYAAECDDCCVHDGTCPQGALDIATPEVSLVSIDSSVTEVESVISLKYDWRACRQGKTWRKEEVEEEVSIPEELKYVTNESLRQRLTAAGEKKIGPINAFTKKLYLHKLVKLEKHPEAQTKPIYAAELASALQGTFSYDKSEMDFNLMEADFSAPDVASVASQSGACCKASFNYLLLDPRVTRNLPARINSKSSMEKKMAAFRTFVAALFYVGKGTGMRPFAHFYDAIKSQETGENKRSEKIDQIHDVWESGLGVGSHHCFQSCIPAEAFTREAVMIEALGIDNLTNKVKGKVYGLVVNWEPKRKRRLGVFLLRKAFELFLIEGEHQLRRVDLK